MSSDNTSKYPPAFYRTQIGSITAIAIHEGTVSRERGATFIKNAPADEVESAFAAMGLDPGQLTLTFTPLALEASYGLVLIDTGFGEKGPPTTGRLQAGLRAAGHERDDVAHVVISHFHGDHITGLLGANDQPLYPNAQVHVPQAEWDYWMDDDEMAAAPEGLQPTFKLCRRIFGAMGDRISYFNCGDEVLGGITAVDANGHTPGQAAFRISSEGETLIFAADVTNNPNVFARHPTWQAAFDINGDNAVETRLRILGEAADNHTRIFFFHAPFPGLGYIARDGDAFVFIPQIWGAES